MNKSTLISATIIAISIIIAAVLHGYMTASNYRIAVGNDLMETALVHTKTGQVWLMADKDRAESMKLWFPAWYRVSNEQWKK